MSSNLNKRIITSIFLLILLYLMSIYTYILIISLIIIMIVSWIEFYGLISKIFLKNKPKEKIIRFLSKVICLLYLSCLVYLIIFIQIEKPEVSIIIFYSILVSIMSDIGGLVVGKLFKGKKLTKISPNKTISGSIGSLLFSILLIPFFIHNFLNQNILSLLIITILISLISQIGDLFISFLKRKAKVKDTSDILPGHGGLLDRIDGIIFAIPTGILLL